MLKTGRTQCYKILFDCVINYCNKFFELHVTAASRHLFNPFPPIMVASDPITGH